MNNAAQIDEFCKERGFIGWFETSAKENINIDEAARFLVTQVRTYNSIRSVRTSVHFTHVLINPLLSFMTG